MWLASGKTCVALLSLTLGMTIECAACSSPHGFHSISRRQRILYLMHMRLINNTVVGRRKHAPNSKVRLITRVYGIERLETVTLTCSLKQSDTGRVDDMGYSLVIFLASTDLH